MTSAVEELLELLDAYSRHPRPHGQRVAGSPNGKSPNSNGLSSDIGSKRKEEERKKERKQRKKRKERKRERESVCVWPSHKTTVLQAARNLQKNHPELRFDQPNNMI